MDFNNYVEIRNTNEPYKRGFIGNILIEKNFNSNLGLLSGLRLTSITIGFNRQGVRGELASNNLERLDYSHRLEYFRLEIPVELKYKILTHEFNYSRFKNIYRAFFINFHTGIALSYQLQADHIRDYNLQNGNTEKTENEFESQLDRNQVNLATQVRIAFNLKLVDPWTISVQPGLSYYTLSTFQNGFKDNLFFYSTRFGVSYLL